MLIGCIDVETTKLPKIKPWMPGSYLVNVGIGYESGEVKQYLISHRDVEIFNQREIFDEIQEELNKITRIIGQNLKFDLQWLRHVGLDVNGKEFYCTQVADYIINGQRKLDYHLSSIAGRYGLPPKIDRVKMFWDAGYETDEIPVEILQEYQVRDCLLPIAIYQRQIPLIKKQKQEALISLQMQLMEMLSRMEAYGVGVDIEKGKKIYAEYSEKVAACEAELKILFDRDDLNLNSHVELSAALFGGTIKREEILTFQMQKMVVKKEPYLFTYKDPKKAPVTKYRNVEVPETVEKERKVIVDYPLPGIFKIKRQDEDRVLSTAKSFLSELRPTNATQERALNILKELSNVSKAAETLIGKSERAGLLKKTIDGIIHTSFNQCVAATGRLTSSDPNGQNLPREGTSPLKEMFIPRLGLIGNGDLSQLEWTVAVWQSNDPVGRVEIQNGVDQHRENAITFFGADPTLDKNHEDFKPLRTIAKVFQFRLLYGGSAYGMNKDPNMPRYSLKQWQQIVEAYQEKYEVLTAWQASNITKVHDSGGWLQIPTGRLFFFEKLPEPDWNGYCYEQAQIKNYPTQGFATGDITPLFMVLVDKAMRKRKLRSKPMLQVHDSVVFDLVRDEVDVVAAIVQATFDNLPRVLKEFFGIDFDLPLRGEFEVGPDYGTLKTYHKGDY